MTEYAYLTTTGRRTGRPHTIEIWYGEAGGTVYLLSGNRERADWVRNLQKEPRVAIRLGGPRERRADVPGTCAATARIVTDPDEEGRARRLLAAKYQGWRDSQPLSDWAREALVVAVDLAGRGG
jgi:deazaflavin-dependent oxidoreductase (nitroreductase family)